MDLTPLKIIYNKQIDIILSDTGLTIPCSLVYETSRIINCPNCIYDTISKKSSNQYKGGGPLPFSNGQTCPFCLGSGTTSSAVAETAIKLAVITDSKKFIGVVNSPNIVAQTICSINHLNIIKKASKIIFNTDISSLTNNIFVRVNEPEPVGLGDSKYIFTNWARS